MAEVIGFLRNDATYGEQQTKRLLQQNLPKEYTVYVETPIYKSREIRYPDFIILTNYGLIVLEVKDWVMIIKADPQGCEIRTRAGETRRESNPVYIARDMAITLSQELKKKTAVGTGEPIPWAHAAILINLPSSVITQLAKPWGQEYVWGRADLENPDILLSRCRNLFPVRRLNPLTRFELDNIRATIYPIVEIQQPNRPLFVLDEQQEKLVSEPVIQEAAIPDRQFRQKDEPIEQSQLFAEIQAPLEVSKLPPDGEKIIQSTTIRLVRGFSGSGKTLVLIQRAKLLAEQFPDWKIGVFTFNKLLQQQLEGAFRGFSIHPRTFHSLCMSYLKTRMNNDTDFEKWLDEKHPDFPILIKLGRDRVGEEINWIRDVGLPERDEYLKMERKGAGQSHKLQKDDRSAIYDVLESYRSYLEKTNQLDWHEIPMLTKQILESNNKIDDLYDAILVDEAQDWAPVWFNILLKFLKPQNGAIFLADDPSQSIFRYFSWKEKGINVVGRTRWLKVPYRNTFEIYSAAYSMIAENEEIQRSLSEEGEKISPALSSETMRHGQKPLIQKCKSNYDEDEAIKNAVASLHQNGIPEKQIGVLVRYKRDLPIIKKLLQGTEVLVTPIHSVKGLEMEGVIIPRLHTTFQEFEEGEANERRLLYMAMSRARSNLVMTYSGRLPPEYELMRTQNLADFIS